MSEHPKSEMGCRERLWRDWHNERVAPKGRDELLDAAAVTKACEAYEAETLNWSQESAIGNAIRAYLAALPAPKGRDEQQEAIARSICRSAHLLNFGSDVWREGELEAKVATYWPKWLPAADAIFSLLPETGQAEGWRSIESAPKDGRSMLIYEDNGPESEDGTRHWIDIAHWEEDGIFIAGSWCDTKGVKSCDPTHWMPIPAPPEGSVS